MWIFNVVFWLPESVIWSIDITDSVFIDLHEVPSSSIQPFELICFTVDSKNVEESGEHPGPEKEEEHERDAVDDTLNYQVFKLSQSLMNSHKAHKFEATNNIDGQIEEGHHSKVALVFKAILV